MRTGEFVRISMTSRNFRHTADLASFFFCILHILHATFWPNQYVLPVQQAVSNRTIIRPENSSLPMYSMSVEEFEWKCPVKVTRKVINDCISALAWIFIDFVLNERCGCRSIWCALKFKNTEKNLFQTFVRIKQFSPGLHCFHEHVCWLQKKRTDGKLPLLFVGKKNSLGRVV